MSTPAREPDVHDLTIEVRTEADRRHRLMLGGELDLASARTLVEAVCDEVARGLAGRRAVISGSGHTIPRAAAAYNERLGAFLLERERALAAGGLA